MSGPHLYYKHPVYPDECQLEVRAPLRGAPWLANYQAESYAACVERWQHLTVRSPDDIERTLGVPSLFTRLSYRVRNVRTGQTTAL